MSIKPEIVEHAISRLEFLTHTIPKLLSEIGEPNFSTKDSPDKWSMKEIIGHLIDSATNNHQRFVRAQFEQNPTIYYDPNKWNQFSFHQQIDGKHIISFWELYNKHLIEIIKRLSEESLTKEVKIGSNTFTIEFLIIDYVEHLEHHLRQVIKY